MAAQLLTVLLLIATAGCASNSDGPDSACAPPKPGQTATECKDFGQGEGPLGG